VAATRQYKKKGAITTLVYCILPRAAESSAAEQLRQVQSPPFFFGTEKGAICYADDLGHGTEVQSIASAIDSMLYFEETARLVVITRSMMLIQYQVSVDGKVSRLSQVKLSVTGDIAETGIKLPVWAGSGLIAAATLEKVVRVFDVAADEAYSLPLLGENKFSSIQDIDLKTDKVTSVAFCPLDR